MSKSKRLSVSDMRGVFRLLSDVRDMRHDQIGQEQLIIDSMLGLLGGTQGFAVRFGGYRKFETIEVEQMVMSDEKGTLDCSYFERWGGSSAFSDDPMIVRTVGSTDEVVSISALSDIQKEQIVGSRIWDEFWEPCEISDALVTFIRYPGSDGIRGYSMHRVGKAGLYNEHDRMLAKFFSEELLLLYKEGKLEAGSVLDGLPGRLKRLVGYLVLGESQKQIASRLGLSYLTVRSYTKELYDVLGVHSRAELVVLVRGGGG